MFNIMCAQQQKMNQKPTHGKFWTILIFQGLI
jgi:hypothetical protein